MLTNSGAGLQLHRELFNWAWETYLGLAEKEPQPVALSETALRPFTGRYLSDGSAIDISPSGDGGLRGQRDVDQEYRAPPEEAEQPAAQRRPDRHRQRADGRPDPDRLGPLAGREHVGQH